MKRKFLRNKILQRTLALALTAILTVPMFGTAGMPAAAAAAEESGRCELNFNNDWRFFKGDVKDGSVSDFDDSEWLYVNTPHSTIQYTPENFYQKDLGVYWYRRHFDTPSEYSEGKQVLLTFGAAMQKAEVWLNDTKIGEHEGGYTEFSLDITEHLKTDGSENVLAVRLDTRPGTDFAPGKVNPDFQYFGGLYRNVTMTVTEAVHITDAVSSGTVAGGGVFLTAPEVSADSAAVKAKTEVENEESETISVTVITELIDEDGITVAAEEETTEVVAAGEKKTFTQLLDVEDPRLWSVNTPELYTVRSTVKADGELCDIVENTYGIRKVEWKRDGCYINDERIELIGTNLHSEMYMVGNAVSDDAVDAEIKRLRNYGFNMIRMAHYPHADSYYAACDKYGVVVIECLAGWQNFNNTAQFQDNCCTQMREMVRANRNHPCIVAWEPSLNESHYTEAWAKALNQVTKEEYPEDGVAKAYTGGWKYWNVFDLGFGTPQHNVVGEAAYYSSKPIVVSEYGDWNMGGFDSTTRVTREPQHYTDAKGGDEGMLAQCDNIQSSFSYNRSKSDWYGAAAYWQYSDYAGFDTEKLTYCGVVDTARIPKHGAYFFQSQRDPEVDLSEYGLDSGAMIYIANTWASDSPDQVRIYSNCERVNLYLDGELIESRTPDKTMYDPRGNFSDSQYGAQPNASSGAVVSTEHLEHPPFTFDLSDYTPGEGTLRAVGLIAGEECAEYVRSAPETEAAISLTAENEEPLKLDGSTAKLVWVDVVDENGTVVNTSDTEVSFETEGPGFVIGEKTVAVRGGQWAVWVRSKRGGGEIVLRAKADGLTAAELVIPTETVEDLPKVPYGGDADETDFIQIADKNNLALNKPASAQSQQGSNSASRAVDGDAGTHWCGEMGPKWWQVDLESSYYVEEVKIAFLWADTSDNGIIRHSFTLQSSEDGKNWTDIETWSDTDQTDNTANAEVTIAVDAEARYLRVNNLTAIKQNGGSNQWVEIAEFTVKGAKTGEEIRMDYGADSQASSSAASVTPDYGNDGNPQTFWIPAKTDENPYWQFDAEGLYEGERVSLFWNSEEIHYYKIEISTDGVNWQTAADHLKDGAAGATTVDELEGLARYVRITLTEGTTDGFWINAVGTKLLKPLKVVEVEQLPTVNAWIGTELKELELAWEAAVTLEDGTKTDLPVVWDQKSYDSSKEGTQTLTGTLGVITGVANTDQLTVTAKIILEEAPTVLFEDVSEADYFYQAVYWAVGRGITNGVTPETFKPYQDCTRADIVTFLYRAMDGEASDTACDFTDVNPNDYYYQAMLWAVEKGITSGYTSKTFAPYEKCTREQIVTFLWRALGSETVEAENHFTDVAEGEWYYKAVLWAVDKGVTTGQTNTIFGTFKPCVRADSVLFIQRALEK